MKNREKRRVRYLRDSTSVRLGGLATNLGRIASFSKYGDHQDVVDSILQESKWFIEWTAADLDLQRGAELVRLQVQLALWQLQSRKNWSTESWRNELAADSKQWSERLLGMSGLLDAS